MHSGAFKSGRTAQRDYHGSVRPIRISNVELRRAAEDVELRFDMAFDDLWRYREGEESGNWNAAWLFIKFRSTQTTADCSEDQLVEKLAPTGHLPGTLADEHIARARKSFKDALRNLPPLPPPPDIKPPEGAPPQPKPLSKEELKAKALAMVGSVSFSAGTAAAEELPPSGEQQQEDGVRFLNLVRTHISLGYGASSPGSTTAQTDNVTIACRPDGKGGTVHDLKEMSRWQTGHLSTNSADHNAPAGMEIEATDDGMGVFLHRAADNPGACPTEVKGAVLRWKAPTDLEFPVRVWVHAVEMVHIPEGSFELGDPQGVKGPSACFRSSRAEVSDEGGERWTWRVSSEEEIPVCGSDETTLKPLMTWDNRGQWGKPDNIPATYPKGYNGFYIMRRQVTQGEYADFLNSLYFHAKTCRFPYGGQGDYRYTIFKTESGLRAATRPNRANNWMSWSDSMAWLWWAGLRPMTEMEYEKACRGQAPAVAEEYAWGSTVLERAMVIKGDEADQEVLPSNCNLDNSLIILQGGDGEAGPVRDDAFALQGTRLAEEMDRSGYAVFLGEGDQGQFVEPDWGHSRQTTGSTYYGVMGMSGNLWEFVVTAGNTIGRSFSGVHGTGELDPLGLPPGNEDESFCWPKTDAEGTGFRGGSWYTSHHKGRVSDRVFASGLKSYCLRSHDTGVRGVRTGPTNKK